MQLDPASGTLHFTAPQRLICVLLQAFVLIDSSELTPLKELIEQILR